MSAGSATAARSLSIVTGASQGFGRAIARALAREWGGDVVIASRNADKLASVQRELQELNSSVRVLVMVEDFSQQDASASFMRRMVAALPQPLSQYGSVLLVNNAASLYVGRLQDLQPADIAQSLSLNVLSVFLLCRGFLVETAALDESVQLSIVNISSLAAIKALAGVPLYCPEKAARDMLHQVVAAEVPRIRTLNYAPGPMEGDMHNQLRTVPSPMQAWARQAQAEGKLVDMDESARKMLRVLRNPRVPSGAHFDFFDTEP